MAEDEGTYEDLTVEELKDELAGRDLTVSGNKADLIARLKGDDEDVDEPVESPAEPEAAPEPEEAPNYEENAVIKRALALEEPLRVQADTLPAGDNSDALKAAIRSASRGIGHMRRALNQMAHMAAPR